MLRAISKRSSKNFFFQFWKMVLQIERTSAIEPKLTIFKWHSRFKNPFWNFFSWFNLKMLLGQTFLYFQTSLGWSNGHLQFYVHDFRTRVMPFPPTRPEFCRYLEYSVALNRITNKGPSKNYVSIRYQEAVPPPLLPACGLILLASSPAHQY